MLQHQPEVQLDELLDVFTLEELDDLTLEPEELEPRIVPVGLFIVDEC